MDDDNPLEPAPAPTAFDHALTVAKAFSFPASFVVPPLGSAVALFDLITAPIRGKRFSEWCERVRLLLNEHSKKFEDLTPEKLAASEEFNSAFAQAAQAAIRTHDQGKLEALRNAVLNTALGHGGDDDRRAIFLSLIDRLTPLHLCLLQFFDEPKEEMARPIPAVIEQAKQNVSRLKSLDDSAIQLLFDDLHRARLLSVTGDNQKVSARNKRWTNNWGHEFLEFLTEPKETQNQK